MKTTIIMLLALLALPLLGQDQADEPKDLAPEFLALQKTINTKILGQSLLYVTLLDVPMGTLEVGFASKEYNGQECYHMTGKVLMVGRRSAFIVDFEGYISPKLEQLYYREVTKNGSETKEEVTTLKDGKFHLKKTTTDTVDKEKATVKEFDFDAKSPALADSAMLLLPLLLEGKSGDFYFDMWKNPDKGYEKRHFRVSVDGKVTNIVSFMDEAKPDETFPFAKIEGGIYKGFFARKGIAFTSSLSG